jgi:regulator of sigma E protease
MLGIALSGGLNPVLAGQPQTIGAIFSRSFDYTIFATQSTIVGLYRVIEGKLSFRKSISGPVKIMAVAAKSVSTGWDTYWFLLANITIVLGIMNLLPIPVLDGGHIVFYLIEALYKPLPAKVIASSMRIGMVILLSLGVYVIGLDIWDVFLKKIFG